MSAILGELPALNKRFMHIDVTNDVAGHDSTLRPDFCNIISQGAHLKLDVYSQRWATGFHPEVVADWDMRDEHINVVGDTALLGATSRWTVVRDGIASTDRTTYTDTDAGGSAGAWLCILAQRTHVPPDHWPGDETVGVKYLRGVLQGG